MLQLTISLHALRHLFQMVQTLLSYIIFIFPWLKDSTTVFYFFFSTALLNASDIYTS